jgi:hypothetical protein
VPVRIIIGALVLALTSLHGEGLVRAAADDDGHSTDRLVVELAAGDSLPAAQQAALRGLLESQLPSHGLSLRGAHDVGDVRRWLSREPDGALLRVALDVSATGWRVLLVDPSRGRATARTLTGGVKRDRAAVEAVCDIVVSAALALHEGLEVASQTVDEALSGEAPRAAATAAPPRGAAAPAEPTTVPRAPIALRVQAGAGPAVATFARAAPASWGAGVAVSVWGERAGVEVAAARYLSQTVAATIGTFAIERTQLGLSAAVAASWPRARLAGGLGPIVEVLRRGDGTPAVGSVATGAPDTSIRLGPQATGSLDVSASRRVVITWALSAGYFPRRVRYLSNAAADVTLAEPWQFTAASTLRVSVVFP